MPEALASCAAGLLRALCLPATDLASRHGRSPHVLQSVRPAAICQRWRRRRPRSRGRL